jgi:hypothetical protein
MSGHNSPEIRHREQTLATRGASATAVLASRPIAPVACIKLAMPSLASRRPAKPATDRHAAAAASSGYGCKPAARLTRSASLLMTHFGRRVCIAALRRRLFVQCEEQSSSTRRGLTDPAVDAGKIGAAKPPHQLEVSAPASV